jgi:FixJ family two-component response regulator
MQFTLLAVLACYSAVIQKHRKICGMSTDSSQTAMIAIIDDDPFVRQATDDLLRSLGYRAATFASAEDFLQSSCIQETTCLISDVQMPGLSGVDLQRVLVAEGNRTPMIFITAFDEIIRQNVMEAGAVGYLSKPFDEDSLIALLESAFCDFVTERTVEVRSAAAAQMRVCADPKCPDAEGP